MVVERGLGVEWGVVVERGVGVEWGVVVERGVSVKCMRQTIYFCIFESFKQTYPREVK